MTKALSLAPETMRVAHLDLGFVEMLTNRAARGHRGM